MLLNKKKLCMVVIGIFGAFLISAQTAELTKRYLTASDEQYASGNYRKAYEYVNRALTLNANGTIPENVVLIAENVYGALLDQIAADHDYDLFQTVSESLEKYPVVANDAIKLQVKKIYAQQESELTAKRDAEAAASRDQERLRYEKQLADQRKSQEALMTALNKGLDTLGSGLSVQAEKTEKANYVVLVAVLSVCAILVIIFIIIILSIRSAARAQRKQQEQFEATLKLVAGMQQTNARMLLGGVTDLYANGGLKSAGSSRWGMDALPEPELSPDSQNELKDLAVVCEDLGSKIDQATNRKNNSKNVSELVYKLVCRLGLNQNTAMVYFCAAMVYDAGFLAIPEEVLQAESLTPEQKEEIRGHVSKAEPFFDFVPEKYRSIFTDAATKHHENMDGSGYPEGLTGETIPQIARLIRVAESYISLISRRNYKAIQDKESAIQELVANPELYDPAVVAVLDAIV
jgi:HD-GYP domain-containing protein (c-di-GMP phosphodiesterase class II)